MEVRAGGRVKVGLMNQLEFIFETILNDLLCNVCFVYLCVYCMCV